MKQGQQGVTRQWAPHAADLSECCKADSDSCSYVGSHGDVSVYVDPKVPDHRGWQHRCVTMLDVTSLERSYKTVIFHLSGRSPAEWIEMKICTRIDLGDIIVEVNFKFEKFQGI